MVGTRRKRSKSKSEALNIVPEEPVPLNVINVETPVSPHGEPKANDMFTRDIAPGIGGWLEEVEEVMTDELNDEEEDSEYEINDTEEEYVSDEDVENSDMEIGEEEQEEDMSSGGDAVTNVDVENSKDGINEEDAEEEEKEEEGEEAEEELEEDVSDGGEPVINMDVENSNNEKTNGEETEEEEEPVSCGSDNEDGHTDEEGEEEEEEEEEEVEEHDEEVEEDTSDEGDAVTIMNVENSKETANEEEIDEEEEPLSFGSDNEVFHSGEEEDTTESFTNINQVENSTANLENDKEEIEPTAEDPISATAENVGDESVKDIASPITKVKTVTEQVILPKKKIIGKRLITKKMPLGKAGTAINGTTLQSRDKVGEASGRGKTGNLKSGEVQGKPTVKVVKKPNKIIKKESQDQSGMLKGNVVQKPKPTNDESLIKYNRTIKQETKNGEGGNSIARSSRLNNRNGEKDPDKPGSVEKGKSTKKAESMGMIFMCSSGTKKDCYKYKVFGLPAGKKDIVSKIYRGMRLFLYDVDSKTLNGIYKAAAPGGFNLEPRAFKSQFPSQVRFSILQNFLPIPEEKFKKVIKDNYYSRNKFHCELTSLQVKNLCKLFGEITKKSESRHPHQSSRPVATSSTRVDRKRRWAEDSRRERPEPIYSRENERRRKRQRSRIFRDQDELRRVHKVRDREEVRYHQPVVVYDRESYPPPVESSSLYQSFRGDDPPRSRIYSYDRDLEADTYRREPAIEYLDQEISGSRESRHYTQKNLGDPYDVAYTESLVYRDLEYESDFRRREQYDYSSPEKGYAKYYSDDYRPPLSLRRRY